MSERTRLMSRVFKKSITRYLDAEGRQVPKGTPGARKVKEKSAKWYGRAPGAARPVPLCENKAAAQMMLNELVRKAGLATVGLADPYEAAPQAAPAGTPGRLRERLARQGRHSQAGRAGRLPRPPRADRLRLRLHGRPVSLPRHGIPRHSPGERPHPAAPGPGQGVVHARPSWPPPSASNRTAVKGLVRRHGLAADRQRQGPEVPAGDRGDAAGSPLSRDKRPDGKFLPASGQAVLPLAGQGPAHGQKTPWPTCRAAT